VIEHCLSLAGFPEKCLIGKHFSIETGSYFKSEIHKKKSVNLAPMLIRCFYEDLEKLYEALQEAEKIFKNAETQLSKVRLISKTESVTF
jgi:hypothetical protein